MNSTAEALELDWDSSFALPVANAENKLLEEAINKKTLDRNQYQTEFEENRNKAAALRDHIKYVNDELVSAQVRALNLEECLKKQNFNFGFYA